MGWHYEAGARHGRRAWKSGRPLESSLCHAVKVAHRLGNLKTDGDEDSYKAGFRRGYVDAKNSRGGV